MNYVVAKTDNMTKFAVSIFRCDGSMGITFRDSDSLLDAYVEEYAKHFGVPYIDPLNEDDDAEDIIEAIIDMFYAIDFYIVIAEVPSA